MQALLPFPAPPLERPGELAHRLTSCWQSHCSHKKIGGQIKVRVVIPGTFNTRMVVYYYFRNNTVLLDYDGIVKYIFDALMFI